MSRTNPFDSHLTKEQVMQAEISRLISFKYPDLFWWHTENEGKRTPFEAYLFKKMGGKAGVSDFVILEESNFSKGLMLEIKCGANTCTVSQVDFLLASIKRGYLGAVVYDYAGDAMSLIGNYLKSGVGLPEDGIVLVKKGITTIVPVSEAYKVLCKKEGKANAVKAVKKLFGKQAADKFGKALKENKLFNSHPV